jgi:hypothetical protein
MSAWTFDKIAARSEKRVIARQGYRWTKLPASGKDDLGFIQFSRMGSKVAFRTLCWNLTVER